jgi:hypothetical protein
MELRLKVIPKDGEAWEVETDLSVIVAWERKFKSKAADLAKGTHQVRHARPCYGRGRVRGKEPPCLGQSM